MGLNLDLVTARAAFAESVDRIVAAASDLAEYDLLGRSRCHGWTRLDVVTHVVAGWQEMLGGMVSQVEDEPTVDAASYWTAFAEDVGGEDPVEVLMSQRRRSAAYARPASACAHLQDVAAAVRRGAENLPDRPCTWQGHVFSAADFLAVWAVEDVVHHLDLDLAGGVPAAALSLARATVEALLGEALPASWSDREAVLIGTGRLPVPGADRGLADRLPVLQ